MIDCLDNVVVKKDMEEIFAARKEWTALKKSKIYITGASGMIASYFTMFLIYLNEVYDYDIQIFAGIRSREKAEKRFGLYGNKSYFTVIAEDVNRPVKLTEKMDYIVHAASLASPQYYGNMPVEVMLPNVIGTYELLEYAKVNPVKKFLFFSTGSVYGAVGDTEKISEETKGTIDFLDLGDAYGESKRCGEALCNAYGKEHGVPVNMARIYHTYSPTMDYQGDTRVFAEFVNDIVTGEDIVIKSSGTTKRSFCYIVDMITALFTIMLEGEVGEAYNIANSDEYVSILELATRLTSLYPEKGLKTVFKAREKEAGYSASKEENLVIIDCTKLEKLAWKSSITIEDGFRRTIDYIESRV